MFTRAVRRQGRAGCDVCVCVLQDVSDIIAVYEAGYGVSLVALLLSLAILFYFR